MGGKEIGAAGGIPLLASAIREHSTNAAVVSAGAPSPLLGALTGKGSSSSQASAPGANAGAAWEPDKEAVAQRGGRERSRGRWLRQVSDAPACYCQARNSHRSCITVMLVANAPRPAHSAGKAASRRATCLSAAYPYPSACPPPERQLAQLEGAALLLRAQGIFYLL